MKIPKQSLIRRALIIFIITLAVSAVLGGILVNYYSEQFLQDISERNLDLAHHVKEGVKIFLDHHVAELLELRLLIDEHGIQDVEPLRDELDRINAFHPLLEQVQILDLEGSIVQVSPYNDEYLGIDMSAHESFKKARELTGNKVYWSDSFISSQTNDPAVTMSLPINNGVLMAHLNLKELSDLVRFSQPVKGEITSIIDKRGVIIAHPDQAAVQQRVNRMNLDSVRQGLENRPGTYREVRDGTTGLSSVIMLEASGWVVSVFQPERVALGVLYNARRIVALSFSILLIITMAAFLVLQHQGMKPIKRLEVKANMIAAGQYGEDLDAEFRELSGFVDSFNVMTKAVRSREEKLRASEERFRVLFDEAAESVFLMDNKGDLIAANKRASQSLGYSPMEFVHMNVSNFIVGEDKASLSKRLSLIAVGEDANVEGQHVSKDGTVFPVEVRIARMEIEGEVHYIAHARDISDRKEAEDALRQSEERFRTAFMTSPDAISISLLKDGTLLNVNEGFYRLTGWTREESLGKTTAELGILVDDSLRKKVVETIKQKENIENLETDIRRKDGSLVSVLLSASIYTLEDKTHMLTIARDITDLKEVQSSLKEAYHLLSTIIDSSPLGIVQTDTEDIIHLWNPAAEEIFGWKAEEIVKKSAPTIPDERMDEYRELLERVQAGEYIFGFETQRKRKDGTSVDVSISLARILLETGDVEIMGIVEDITERKAVEDALRESEERLRKISEGVIEGIAISSKGRIVETNNQLAEMLGYKVEEIVGKEVTELVSPEHRDLVMSRIKEGYEGRYEHGVVRKDGSELIVEVKGTNTTYKGMPVRVASILDITDQRRAENVLKEREKRYRLLYENNPLSYQSLNESVEIKEVNAAWINLTGYKADEAIGKSFLDLVSEDYKEIVEKNFPRLLKRGEIQVPDLEIISQDGQKIHVTLFGRASVDEETGEMRIHCLLHDITERTRMEDALKKGAQLAAVGQVASGIAHEINNPLATISASTEALLARLVTLRKETGRKKATVNILNLFQEYLTMIMGEVNRSSQIIRDLLDFTRMRDYVFADLAMDDLINSTVRLLRVQSRMGKHTFEVESAPDLPQIRGDRDRLRQVLIILLTNAVESMPEGGTIAVGCREDKRRKTVMMSVKDTGTGISQDKIDHIFEPFYTTKEPGSGTGLGLSIADKIVSRHGGLIEVKTNKGRGATFTVILPIQGPDEDTVQEGTIH